MQHDALSAISSAGLAAQENLKGVVVGALQMAENGSNQMSPPYLHLVCVHLHGNVDNSCPTTAVVVSNRATIVCAKNLHCPLQEGSRFDLLGFAPPRMLSHIWVKSPGQGSVKGLC